jgi:hypothetical protein
MSSVTFATPFRTAPPTLQYSAPVRVSFDDAGAALSEAEASEFAVRLIDARSEADFDHLLCAILTHAARAARSPLRWGARSAACSRALRGKASRGGRRRKLWAWNSRGSTGTSGGLRRLCDSSAWRPRQPVMRRKNL